MDRDMSPKLLDYSENLIENGQVEEDGNADEIIQVEKDDVNLSENRIGEEVEFDWSDSEFGYQNFLQVKEVYPTTSTQKPQNIAIEREDEIRSESEPNPNHINVKEVNVNPIMEELKKLGERIKKIEDSNDQILRNQRSIMRQLVVLRSNPPSSTAVEDADPDYEVRLPCSTVDEFQELESKCKEDDKIEKYLVCYILLHPFLYTKLIHIFVITAKNV